MATCRHPEVSITVQGPPFTKEDWNVPLKAAGLAISIYGKGR
jgi:hypothetical protein